MNWSKCSASHFPVETSPVCKLVTERDPVFLYQYLEEKQRVKSREHGASEYLHVQHHASVAGTIKPLIVR